MFTYIDLTSMTDCNRQICIYLNVKKSIHSAVCIYIYIYSGLSRFKQIPRKVYYNKHSFANLNAQNYKPIMGDRSVLSSGFGCRSANILFLHAA